MIGHLIRRIQTDSRGSALVYTLLVTAVLMIAAVAIISVTGIDSKLVQAQEEQKIVQYAAESVVEVIRQELLGKEQLISSMTTWTELRLDDIQCKYRYKVEQPSDQDLALNRFVVTVNTQVTFDSGNTAEKDLELVIQYTPGKPGDESTPGQPENPPPAGGNDNDSGGSQQPQFVATNVFDYALVGGGMLPLANSGLAIAGNVFSNSSIQLDSNSNIAGTVYAVGAITFNDNIHNDNIHIEPNQLMPLTLPVVNGANLTSTLTGANIFKYGKGLEPYEITESDVTELQTDNADGSIVNKVVYVFGSVYIPRAIPKYTLIVASGDIYINGDSTVKMPHAGIITDKNIYVEGQPEDGNGPEIHGFLLAGDNVIISGSSAIWGTVVAGNHLLPGKNKHVIYQDKAAVEAVFRFIEAAGRTRKDIIANYDQLNVYYPVLPVGNPGTTIPNHRIPIPDSPSGSGSSNGTPPEITIIRWKEIN